MSVLRSEHKGPQYWVRALEGPHSTLRSYTSMHIPTHTHTNARTFITDCMGASVSRGMALARDSLHFNRPPSWPTLLRPQRNTLHLLPATSTQKVTSCNYCKSSWVVPLLMNGHCFRARRRFQWQKYLRRVELIYLSNLSSEGMWMRQIIE